ncbi:peptidoglycan glycosyltransferase OS=Streptomyces tendae OX=1932 GN=rodA PE=4 SV=1 [Streptomyces tendae]
MTGNSFQVSGYGPEKAGWTRSSARDSIARRLDWPILLAAVALSLLARCSSTPTRNRTELNQGDPYYFLNRTC